MMRDSRVESLLVVGYNPSHKNIKSEVNAPFKMLSTLLRFLASESKDKEKKVEGKFAPNGERLDTVEGYNELYDEEADNGSQFDDSFRYGESDDENRPEQLEVNMDELEDNQEGLLDYNPPSQQQSPETGGAANLSDKDLDACSDTGSTVNFKKGLFEVKIGQDKGLADIETGSEVYMSELLVSTTITDHY